MFGYQECQRSVISRGKPNLPLLRTEFDSLHKYEYKMIANLPGSYQFHLSNLLGNKTKYLPEIKKIFIRPLMQIAIKAIEEEYIEDGILERLSEKYNISEESIGEYYAIVSSILSQNLYESVHLKDFKHTLEELRLPTDSIDDLASVVYGQKQADLVATVWQKTVFYPHLKLYKWRVNITVSSSMLTKVLEPHIAMEWIFSTGERKTFELSLLKFHQLRHAIASILVGMQELNQQNILKSSQNN